MRRGLIGLALLAGLLGLGLWAQRRMDAIHAPISAALVQAGTLAEAEQWPQAAALAHQAQTAWQQGRRLTASLADHQPMEDIESLMSQLDSYIGHPEFPALCADLARKVDAMREAHRLELGTLF